jgi:hypothetical protein
VLQKLLAHQNDPAPDVRELRPDVPEILAALLATMLAKEPEQRFQTPLDLSAALTSCIEQLGLTPPAVALPAYFGNWSPPATWWRFHAPWIVPFALLAMIVLILGVVWHREAEEPSFPKFQHPQVLRSEAPEEVGWAKRRVRELGHLRIAERFGRECPATVGRRLLKAVCDR